MTKHTCLAVCLHCFNWIQAIRLLATRGHYSIDLIIGYIVAAFVSSPAERLGVYYSRGIPPVLPGLVEAFEILVGVDGHSDDVGDEMNPLRQSSFLSEWRSAHGGDLGHVQSETSMRVAVDIVADIAQMKRD